MESLSEEEKKFKLLQKNIQFLESFCNKNASDTKKLEKAKILLKMLQEDYRGQSLIQLINIEKTLEGMKKIVQTKMVAKSTIKSERTDSPTAPTIKMESKGGDFQSPESPPMFSQDVKCEPITIPTERRDSNQYRYDSPFDSRRPHYADHRSDRELKYSDYRNDEYRRSSYERRRRSRSRSRSRSYSRSHSRSRSRSRERKRHRRSRSRSRDRKHYSRSKGSHHRRSDSRDKSPSSSSRYRRSSSRDRRNHRHRSRSISPAPRSRIERRDERKYVDTKRGIKQDPDYERESYKRENTKYSSSAAVDSKEQLSVTAQAFFKKEKERNEMTNIGNSSTSTKKPLNTFGNSVRSSTVTATVTSSSSSSPLPTPSIPLNQPYYKNRFSNGAGAANANIKREPPKLTTQPHPSMRNRFDAGPSAVELADVDKKKYFSDEDIEENDRANRIFLSYVPSEKAKEIKDLDERIKFFNQQSTIVENRLIELSVKNIFNEYDEEEDEEYNKRNEPTAAANTSATITATDPRLNNSRNSSSGSIRDSDHRNERVTPIRPSIHSRLGDAPNACGSPNATRFENRATHPNRSYDESPQSPDQTTSTNTIPAPKPPCEERIALSNKYVRRPRNSSTSGPTTPELSSAPHVDPLANIPAQTAPPQDPRLRNRPPNITSSSVPNVTESPFMPYRNHQQMPVPMPHGPNAMNHGFMQDAYQPPPPSQQSFPRNPQHGRPGPNVAHHMPHHQAAMNHGFNTGYGSGNLPPPHANNRFRPHNIPPFPNQSMHMDPRQLRQPQIQGQFNQQKETYRDHKIRKEREEKERAEAAAAAAAAAISSTTVASDKTDEEQSNQEQSSADAANKDAAKESTEDTVFRKAYSGNNWDALNKSSGNSFKIPKLNKSNAQSSNKSATAQISDRSSPNEMNVTTSTGKDATNDKNVQSKKRKDSTKKSTDKKSRNSLDENSQDADAIVADTTIDVDTDRMEEEKSTEKSPPTQQQPIATTEKPEVNEILETLKNQFQLPQDKLQAVLSIISPDNANENTVTSSTVPAALSAAPETGTVKKAPVTARKSFAGKASANTASAPTKSRKQKHSNELDRLTADIRENIPDVLSAIGPRACTLNAPKLTDTSPRKAGAAKEITSRRASSGHKSDDDASSEIEKPSARIVRRRNTTVESRPPIIDDDDSDDDSSNVQMDASRAANKRPRNLLDSDDESEAVNADTMPAKRRSGPKSKESEKNHQPVELQKELRIVLEKVDDSKEMQRITRASKRKAEADAASSESGEQPESNEAAAEPADTERDVKPSLTTLTPNETPDESQIEKNTNLSYTVKSNKCVLCDRSTQYLSTHYRNNHDAHEVYSARMSSKKANQLRRNPAKPATRNDGKINAYCYYCEHDVSLIRNRWVDHLIRHTGEYTRHCKICGSTVTTTSDKSKCSHPDPAYKAIVEFTDTLFVYMCNFCNYTQSQEENLNKHIRQMHQHESNVTSHYQKIILIPNFAGRSRGVQRTLSTDGSESSSSISNTAAFITTTSQNEDEINDARRLLESTTNYSADAGPASKRSTVGQSIIDRLNARFDSGNSVALENPIKKETGANEPTIVYRAPDEMNEHAKQAAAAGPSSSTAAAASTSSTSLRHGSVIENEYKIELNKTEQGHDASAIQNDGANSGDDDDDDDRWESLSSESEAEEEVNTPNAPGNQFSHLLMAKKNNKPIRSRQQQQKKRSSFGLSSMVCKAEKSDDAVNAAAADNGAGHSKQKTPEAKSSPEAKRLSVGKEDALRVDNIGWNECMGEQKYYCYIGNCGFISQNNLDSLSNHLRQKHSNNPWTGYCYKCDQQIFNNRCSLMKEFDHLKSHLPEKVLAPPPPKSSPSTAAVKASEPSPSPTAAQILAARVGFAKVLAPPNIEPPQVAAPTVPPPQPRPFIQVRPIAELLQSSINTAIPSTSTAMQLQPIQLGPMQPKSQPPLVIASVSSLKTQNPMMELNRTMSGVTVSLANDNPLKPWTSCPNTKSSFAEEKLRRECSLIALFKCMAIDCIFTTSDEAKMLQHLQNHEDQNAVDSSNAHIVDDPTWLECCYCEEVPGSETLLVEHIIQEHSASIFQCPQCFYRSVDVRNLFSHLEKYHRPGLDPLISGAEMKDVAIDIKAVVAARTKVQEFKCPDLGCGTPVMHLAEFTKHIKTAHAHKNIFTCTICGLMLTKSAGGEVDLRHFTTHGFALCNCPYCPHQCDTMDLMQDHLRDKHPSRFSYALVRMSGVKKDNLTAPPNSASIYKIADMPQQYRFTYTRLTEAQINYMDPALDSEQNEFDPIRPEPSSVFYDKRAKFIQLYRTETSREDQLRAEHGIQRASDLLHTPNKRAETFVLKTQPEQSSSTSTSGFSAIPIIRTVTASASAPAPPVATATTSSNVGNSVPGSSPSKLTDFNDVYQNEVDASAKLIVESGGNVELDELYHCSFPECGWVRGNDCEFLAHLSQHDFSGSFECYHCNKRFSMAVDLKKHIKIHQICRFFCFYCEFMSATQLEMEQHFSKIHGCDVTAIQAVNACNFDLSTDLFVVCPSNTDLAEFYKRLMARAENLNKSQRKFLPTQIDKLPKSQIFCEDLECALCGFRSRVRSNLIRHFNNGCNKQQAHAPVNPVNQSNERHFDKMRNLAASSNSSDGTSASALEHGLGKYVPETDRYSCCARSCVYRNCSPDLLLKHIETLHSSDKEFSCPHCSTDLSANCTPKEFLNHLRYHDSRIYKCPSCPFIHYLKQPVDKHIGDTHPNVRERAITLDRPAKKEEPPKINTPKTGSFKWKCNDCSASFDTRPAVKQHLQAAHRLSYQFKCIICQYSHDQKSNVEKHLSTVHGEIDSSKLKSNFERIEVGEDNSPLWRRNDPSRVKHIRGILFDDAEKSRRGSGGQSNSGKSPLIHLEINPVQVIQIQENPTKTVIASASGSNKKSTSKVSQDDSVLNFKVSSRDLSNRGNDDRFVILPPREVSTVEEEVRPRPASLRQQPKRRFSTYIPSTNDMCQQPSTSSTAQPQQQQPPISLRLKRISDPITDTEKMPPPKFSKITVKKVTPAASTASATTAATPAITTTTTTLTMPMPNPMSTEKVDLNTLGLIYLCYHCEHQTDNFDAIHAHWLKVHKKGEDPTTKRFCYRLTKQVRCVYCPNDGNSSIFTYQTIRKHMTSHHKNCPYAYAKHNPSNTANQSMECGQCAKVMPTIADLQVHFDAKHKSVQKPTTSSIDPLPIINDATLNALLEQGDQGTFKCAYCSCFYSCRYDYDQHHREDHRMIPQKYELNGKYVIKYGCFVCPQIKTDEAAAIEHMRTHFPIGYQCQYCPTQFKFLSAIVPHHGTAHDANLPVRFKLICTQDHFIACTQLILTFSNGLTLLWGDVMNTKFGGENRLRKWVGSLIDQQNQQQLKAYNEVIKSKDFTSNGSSAGGSSGAPGMIAGKIGHRRQTHL